MTLLTSVVSVIKSKYEAAVRKGQEFILENANNTICDRPYVLRGEPVTSLNTSILTSYNAELDTTTKPSTTTTTSEAVLEEKSTTPLIQLMVTI